MRLIWTALVVGACFAAAADNPNVVVILADDLGYGDLACYNPESKIPTPHLDRLASQGMRFTDAHSPATVCTPSRYGLLTGRLAFREKKGRGVFVGVGGSCRIDAERLTLPGMLQQKGYRTGLFGKWHVGMTFYDKETGEPVRGGGVEAVRRADFSRPIPDGPTRRGFDEFFGTVCCPTTDYLYAYVDGDRVTEAPTLLLDKEEKARRGLPDNPYTQDFRVGLAAKGFEPENVDQVFLEKSQDFLRRHQAGHAGKPFFMILSTQSAHLPSIPAPAYRGKTNAGPHGDFVFMLDDVAGKLLATLDELGVADDTLVLFSSDNGPELPTVKLMRETYQHDGARPWRGVKRDGWEGGHRVPLLVRWPGKVKPGSVSDQLINLTDVMATLAAVVGHPLPDDAAEDSYNQLPALLGETTPVRPHAVQESTGGNSLRMGKWKYLDHPGSGGNDYARTGPFGAASLALPDSKPDAPAQLYDLEADPGERKNLFAEHPELAAKMAATLRELVDSGRSAPPRTAAAK